jgi:two-component system, cell cycle response regulator
MDGRVVDDAHDRRAVLLDDLEYHRNFGVDARLERAIEIEREMLAAGETDFQMRARLVQADMRLRRGQAAIAAHLATEVNHWARERQHTFLLARSHLVLSSIFEGVGDGASCLDHALRALELLGEDATPRTRGNFLIRLADALSVARSFDEARLRYREAEEVFASIGDVERQINVLNNLAYAEYEAGDSRLAWDVAVEMQNQADATGYVLTPSHLDTWARIHIGLGEYDQAACALEAALAAYEADGDVQAVTPAELMLTLAEVQRSQGRLDLARETLEKCRAICGERSLGGLEVEVLRVQAELDAAAGQFDRAYEGHKIFHSEFLKLNSMRREASARTRQALFETAEARQEAQRFWRQARTDALTGLPNRRFVDEEIPRLLGELATGTPLVVAIVDVDRFKRINDTLLHEVGDRVICELGRVLQQALPAGPDPTSVGSSFVARLGGEEFLVTLPGYDMAAAIPILNAVRTGVAKYRWKPLIGGLKLTVSVGVSAALPRDTQSALLARADRNLYAAKSAGRNRVVVDRLPGEELEPRVAQPRKLMSLPAGEPRAAAGGAR